MEITGKTKFFPIIGRPVSEVFSPPAYNRWFRVNKVDCRMLALDLSVQDVSPFLSLVRMSPSFIGCSVTYPCKQAAFLQVDNLTTRASRIGAVNTVRREGKNGLSGDATDGLAIVEAIETCGGSIKGNSAIVLGAGGGAGRAIVDALCESGISRLQLLDIDKERLQATMNSIAQHWPEVSVSARQDKVDILVNATTLGKSDEDSMPFDKEQILGANMVCDVVTRKRDTRLINLAQGLGCATVTGTDMGIGQLKPQLSFLGLNPE